MPEASKVLPPSYFFGAVVILLLVHFFFPLAAWLVAPWTYVSVVPLLLGAVLVLQPARVFEKRNTTIKPFQESTTLVTDGFFRISRNPMYLGMVLLLAGLAVFFGTASAAVVPAVFMWVVTRRFILAEEAALLRTFGSEYEDYRRRVRRWI